MSGEIEHWIGGIGIAIKRILVISFDLCDNNLQEFFHS